VTVRVTDFLGALLQTVAFWYRFRSIPDIFFQTEGYLGVRLKIL